MSQNSSETKVSTERTSEEKLPLEMKTEEPLNKCQSETIWSFDASSTELPTHSSSTENPTRTGKHTSPNKTTTGKEVGKKTDIWHNITPTRTQWPSPQKQFLTANESQNVNYRKARSDTRDLKLDERHPRCNKERLDRIITSPVLTKGRKSQFTPVRGTKGRKERKESDTGENKLLSKEFSENERDKGESEIEMQSSGGKTGLKESLKLPKCEVDSVIVNPLIKEMMPKPEPGTQNFNTSREQTPCRPKTEQSENEPKNVKFKEDESLSNNETENLPESLAVINCVIPGIPLDEPNAMTSETGVSKSEDGIQGPSTSPDSKLVFHDCKPQVMSSRSCRSVWKQIKKLFK